MSEIEESSAGSSHDRPRSSRNEDAVRLLGDRPPEREGLPRGYRMRADSHYVDQLESRAAGPAIRLVPARQIESAERTPSAGLEALVRSIALHGIVQPLLVRRRNGRYHLIAGRKRLAAALAAGISEVPCFTFDVDDSEAAALAEADNLRLPDNAPAAGADWLHDALTALSTDAARIASSAGLLGPSRGFQRRIAADLIQAQAWRAAWLAAATAVALGRHRTSRAASVASIVDRVKAGFEPESRLTRLQLDCSVSPGAAVLTFEEDFGAIAIAGCVFATLAWLEDVEEPRVEVRADVSTSRTLKVEVVQRTTPVPADMARYLREPGQIASNELTVALGLVAANCLAAQHGGTIELTSIAGGGSIIQGTFSKPSAN